jgi:hypothetical protein
LLITLVEVLRGNHGLDVELGIRFVKTVASLRRMILRQVLARRPSPIQYGCTT